jgi:hypothetical protein
MLFVFFVRDDHRSSPSAFLKECFPGFLPGYSTLKQVKRTEIDFLCTCKCIRIYSQEDFTLEKAHSHPPNYEKEKRQLTFILENISTAESAQVSADMGVSIDYQNTHIVFLVNNL